MDLKFSFEGASPDHHDHGGAPSGVPLPISIVSPGGLTSAHTSLEVRVHHAGDSVVAEAVSGDGVTYARATVLTAGTDATALARAARSALARAVAELEAPLIEVVTAVVLDVGPATENALSELGIDPSQPTIDGELQRRIGIAAGTPIRMVS